MEIWGFPEKLAADKEKGICSEATKAWLEANNCRLIPMAPSSGSRHTQFGIIDVHSSALRGVLHRLDSSLVERKVKTSAEELFMLIAWAMNSTRGRGGVAPIQSAAGMVPRDPLNMHLRDELTTTQISQPITTWPAHRRDTHRPAEAAADHSLITHSH